MFFAWKHYIVERCINVCGDCGIVKSHFRVSSQQFFFFFVPPGPFPPNQLSDSQPRPSHLLHAFQPIPLILVMGNCQSHVETTTAQPGSKTQGPVKHKEDCLSRSTKRLSKPLRHSSIPADSLCLQPFCVA